MSMKSHGIAKSSYWRLNVREMNWRDELEIYDNSNFQYKQYKGPNFEASPLASHFEVPNPIVSPPVTQRS